MDPHRDRKKRPRPFHPDDFNPFAEKQADDSPPLDTTDALKLLLPPDKRRELAERDKTTQPPAPTLPTSSGAPIPGAEQTS